MYGEQLDDIARALNAIARALNRVADEMSTPLQGERLTDLSFNVGDIADAIREANGGSAASAE